jgi:hypothetical protein
LRVIGEDDAPRDTAEADISLNGRRMLSEEQNARGEVRGLALRERDWSRGERSGRSDVRRESCRRACSRRVSVRLGVAVATARAETSRKSRELETPDAITALWQTA